MIWSYISRRSIIVHVELIFNRPIFDLRILSFVSFDARQSFLLPHRFQEIWCRCNIGNTFKQVPEVLYSNRSILTSINKCLFQWRSLRGTVCPPKQMLGFIEITKHPSLTFVIIVISFVKLRTVAWSDLVDDGRRIAIHSLSGCTIGFDIIGAVSVV